MSEKLIVIHTDYEDVITVPSMIFQVVDKYLRKGKGVKSPNGDWYERERNYDPETLNPKSGYHVLKYPKGKSPYQNVGSWNVFKEKIIEIWSPDKFKEVPLLGNKTTPEESH